MDSFADFTLMSSGFEGDPWTSPLLATLAYPHFSQAKAFFILTILLFRAADAVVLLSRSRLDLRQGGCFVMNELTSSPPRPFSHLSPAYSLPRLARARKFLPWPLPRVNSTVVRPYRLLPVPYYHY